MIYGLISTLLAAPNSQEIQAALESFNRSSYYTLPTLSNAQLQDLLAGNTLSIIDQQGGTTEPRRAVGIRLSDQPKDKLWIACQDAHFSQQSSTKELRINFTEPDSATWYGFLDLPWPFSDRHWYVRVWNNHQLAIQTNNLAWEHPWELIEGGAETVQPYIAEGKLSGITVKMMDAAVYTPVNKGAWAMMTVEDSTLIIYHATTQVGGNIPEEAILRYIQSGLDEMLRNIDTRAAQEISQHYSGSHILLPGGDGKMVPHFQ